MPRTRRPPSIRTFSLLDFRGRLAEEVDPQGAPVAAHLEVVQPVELRGADSLPAPVVTAGQCWLFVHKPLRPIDSVRGSPVSRIT